MRCFSKTGLAVLAGVLILAAPLAGRGGAQMSESTFFDAKDRYDIYFMTIEDDVSVIRSVKILGFENIKGREFLVILPELRMEALGNKGYILYDSVRAILPSNNFVINSR